MADIYRLLEALQVLVRKIKRRVRENRVDELLRDIEDQRALIVVHRRTRYRGLIFCGRQPMLAFLSALEEVANAQIKLGLIFEIGRVEFARSENGEELRVPGDRGIGTQVRGDFLGLVLQDRSARGKQRMVALRRKINRLVQRDSRGSNRSRRRQARQRHAMAVVVLGRRTLRRGALSRLDLRQDRRKSCAGDERR